jgi:hypothetical protein
VLLTTRFLYRKVTSHSIYRTNQKRFVNNFKAIGKVALHLVGAPGTFCVERTPEGRKEIKSSPFVPGPLRFCWCVNMANPAIGAVLKETNLALNSRTRDVLAF